MPPKRASAEDMACRVLASTWFVGSSTASTSGAAQRAQATWSRFSWPPESVP